MAQEARINQGAYEGAQSLSAAAGEGAREAIAGGVADYDKAQVAQRDDRESKSKLETANLQQQTLRTALADKERLYRKDYTVDQDALARQSATTQTDFANIKTNLFPLKERQRNGTITEEETAQLFKYEGAVDSFKQVYEAEEVAVAEYNKVGDTTGFDDNSDPNNRLKALALASKQFKLTQVDGTWRYQGEYEDADGNLVQVDEAAAGFLDNLNLTAKTDWPTSNSDAIASLDWKTTKITNADGRQVDDYTFERKDVIKIANADLSVPDKLDSYAFQYLTTVEGLSDEEARQRVDDYGTDGYGEFKTTLRDYHTDELLKEANQHKRRVTTKYAPIKEVKPLFTATEVSTFDDQLKGISNVTNPADFSAIDTNKLTYELILDEDGNPETNADGEPTGRFSLFEIDKAGKALGSQTFKPGEITAAQRFAEEAVLGDKGGHYKKIKDARQLQQTAKDIRERSQIERLQKTPEILNSPQVRTGHLPRPPKGKTLEERAIRKTWEENNYDI